MNDVTISEYSKSPCGMTSLPYWKHKRTVIPDNMKVIHNRQFRPEDFTDYIDEPYFRLYHDLKTVDTAPHSDQIQVITAAPNMTDVFVHTINASYNDLRVTKEQIDSYRETPVYDAQLWVLLKDKGSGDYIGSGIADYDKEIGELILEWIQVLPSYRGRGYGKAIVNTLLSRMQGTAKFATVSGKVKTTSAERLYRACGFTGNDVWHILSKAV